MAPPVRHTIAIPDLAIADLWNRLSATRFIADPGPPSWDRGTPPGYLAELMDYWRSGFDWRAREAALNDLPQYQLEIGEVKIHFLHYRGQGPRPTPIILTHGWPGSFYEFHRLAPLLADAVSAGADASESFDVVVPSLPGFTFSSLPRERPRDFTSALWVGLMDELGYGRFIVHAGDLGAGVSEGIARRFGDRLIGLHLTSAFRGLSSSDPDLDDEERAFLRTMDDWERAEGAYEELQATKPATIAAALVDSPVGLAAWMVEKYRAWSDCGGDIERRFSKDDLLTIISLYWFTETIYSSFMPYFDHRHREPPSRDSAGRVDVPTGVARFPADLPSVPPESSVARRYNLVRYRSMPEGGHFPALEVPQVLAAELRAFARTVKPLQGTNEVA